MIVGLDIGTSKTCVAVGERDEQGNLQITGMGLSPSTGIRKGVVVNIEATLNSIAAAVEAAEFMCGADVHNCWTGIGGTHVDGINSRGVVTVSGKNRETREIDQDDLGRVLQLAQEISIPLDRQILEVIPQSYIVDGQKGIRNPLDMLGVRLEAEVHIITCSSTSAQNLIKCVNRAGFHVEDLVLQSLAAGRSVLTEEEKEMGVALIDMGGGTTELLVYSDGALCFIASIPVGSELISRDISAIKSISFDSAEKVKIEAGCCWEGLLGNDEIRDGEVIISGLGGRPTVPIPRTHILKIARPRVEEIYRMVKEKLDKQIFPRPIGAGLVLTGGGASLPGAAELASYIFDMPVRVGNPLPMPGLAEEYRGPMYATAIGLALEGNDRRNYRSEERGRDILGNIKGGSRWGLGKMFDWLKDVF
ncbi:MAG: cell division protein FtsA [Treponema sp.]|jgi:cell division protein FtsA|nr:cell division protein FtsA [Treponema sp.]